MAKIVVWLLLTLLSFGASVDLCPSSCICHSKHNLTCSVVPSIKLSNDVLYLKVTGDIPVVTKEVTSLMGDMLKVLDLSNCCIRNIAPDALHSKSELVFLSLASNHLHHLPHNLLQYNTKLEKLYLQDNSLEEIPDQTLQNCHSLKLLHLQHNRLRRIPEHLPHGLEILEVSNNNIDIHPKHLSKLNLIFLNLCDNPLRLSTGSDVFKIKSLQALCLGYHHLSLPDDLGTHFPHLQVLFLKGRNDTEKTALNNASLASIGTLKGIHSLALENYVLETLLFLGELKTLRTLRLLYSDLMIPPEESITYSTEPDLQHLQELSLDGSNRLVQALLGDTEFVAHMEQLHRLSLRNTGLVSLPKRHIPESVVYIDISDNPLRCDCGLSWLQSEIENNPGALGISHDATCATIHSGDKTPAEHRRDKYKTRHSRSQHRHKRQHIKDHQDTKPLLKFLGLKLDCDEDKAAGHLELIFNHYGYLPITSDDEPEHESDMLIYIILIVILAVLMLIGIVLAIVLCLYKKKKRELQILPAESCSASVDGNQKIHSSSTTIFVKRPPTP